LGAHLGRLLARRPPRLVVDLAELAFTSSLGLSALIEAHRKCQAQGGCLILAEPQAAILKVFQTTRLDTLFQICPTVQEAVKLAGLLPAEKKLKRVWPAVFFWPWLWGSRDASRRTMTAVNRRSSRWTSIITPRGGILILIPRP